MNVQYYLVADSLKQRYFMEKSLHPVMYPTILHFCLFHYIDHTKILVTLMLHFREILLSRDIDKRR